MEIQIEKMTNEHLNLINLEEFDDFWNTNILNKEINSSSSYYIIAKSEDEIVGFAGISIILDETSLENIVVKKTMRNKKIGSLLLETLITKAKTLANLITLEVNEKNLQAIHLYKKYGFEIIGKRKKYYNNKDAAYLMTKYFN